MLFLYTVQYFSSKNGSLVLTIVDTHYFMVSSEDCILVSDIVPRLFLIEGFHVISNLRNDASGGHLVS